jgi:chromosome segregation and condensation protein ScpB
LEGNIEISYPRLKNILESLLFITKKPVSLDELQAVIGVDKGLIERSLYDLLVEYEARGINIVKFAGGYQMVTRSENVEFVDRFI